MNFAKTVAAALNIPDWRLFYIRTQDSDVTGCMTVKFGIIGNGKYRTFIPSVVFVMSKWLYLFIIVKYSNTCTDYNTLLLFINIFSCLRLRPVLT